MIKSGEKYENNDEEECDTDINEAESDMMIRGFEEKKFVITWGPIG